MAKEGSSGKGLGKRQDTQAALRAAVFRAVQLMESNLDQPRKVDELAQAAGLSKFHFQRAFKEVVGETVAQHSIRLRLERAAVMLRYSSWQAGEIALAAGYKTQASFTRDFSKLYGCSPQKFRESEAAVPFLRGYLRSRPEVELEDPALPVPTVRVENWRDLEMICLRFYGPVDRVHEPWGEILDWAKNSVPDLKSARFFGIWYDDWSGKDEEHYRYECAIVPREPLPEPPPEPFFLRTLEAGEVAVAEARGNLEKLDRAWQAFGNGWLPFSGYQPRGEAMALDEYPADLMLASKARQLAAMVTGLSLKMCLRVQRERVAV